ncbi:MAG TPA: hypothetical protein VEH47_08495 [Candidatus Acidoferrales bacterium]|nr:hypothetical protein [Candidatus Acidoferrales bacterium]
MWLVLCSSSDTSGLWVYQGLRQLGVGPMELVLSEWLAFGSRWEHRLDGSATQFRVTLPDGRVLCSSRIRGAINRLLAPAPGIDQQAAISDREYAHAELQAFYLSWLQGLPGVMINRPGAVGLCGPWYHTSEWVCRASRAGLKAPVYRQSAHETERGYASLAPEGATTINVIAFRGEVYGERVGEPVARACARLAQEARTELLGIELYAGQDGEWTFASATPCPGLSVGGMPLLHSLADALTEGATS